MLEYQYGELMRRILILGGGTAGTVMANRLRNRLEPLRWEIVVLDRSPEHVYQPGLLFLPFGMYNRRLLVQPRERFLPREITLLYAKAERILPEQNCVELTDGRQVEYDLLVIATGADVHPQEQDGLLGVGWRESRHEFYTLEGALSLREVLSGWSGGRLVVNIAEMPIKCPVAPIEFLFLADWWFTQRGIRDKVELTLATPLSGAFTRPMCSTVLGHLFREKRIELATDFALAAVDGERRVISDWGGRELNYDLLVSVPTNMGDPLLKRSGLGDELNFVPTDPQTLQAKGQANIFVLGDATDLPSSKAGSVAHFQAELLTENILRCIGGEPLEPSYDGHTNCFIETGYGKAVLVDFNYDTEPLPGRFPLPHLGPFTLLGESRINHLGKLAFRWIYWNLLLRGRSLLIPPRMSMAGKLAPDKARALLNVALPANKE